MTKQELIQQVIDLKLKKSEVEKAIGLTSNSLSAICSGKKVLPEKYVESLRKYLLDKTNNLKFVVASGAPVIPVSTSYIATPSTESMTLNVQIPEEVLEEAPMHQLWLYCQENKIGPEDLIEAHKNWSSKMNGIAKETEKQKADLPVATTRSIGLSERQLAIRKNKLGF